MKLKKSYILLIVMSIFLLISIGSACASENITDDGDIGLADDEGESVVLSDTSDTVENVPDDTQKANTTIETENDTYKFAHDGDKNISVEVKSNKSNIDVNKKDLTVLEGNKTINFEYNNTIIAIKDTLSVGNHTLAINYLGSANYTNSSKIITVQIFGNNTIETETSVVCDGKNIEIPVKVFDGVEYVEMIKTNFNLTLVYTNETGNISNIPINDFDIIDGKIKFTTPAQLIAASLIIDYANATEPKTVGIKVATEIKAEVAKDQFKSEEIKNISITLKDGQGNLINISKNDLNVLENGKPVAFTYNNTNITITSISEGAHNLTIVYKGNESYNESSTNVTLNVYGKNQIKVPEYVVTSGDVVEIPITIFNGLENITINGNNLTLNLTYTNETGNVTSKIITDAYNDGKISFNVNGLALNKASLTIDYIDTTGAKTVKINLATNVTATPDEEKYRFNETNNITVKVLDNTGNAINVTKADLRVFDNGKEITDFTYNNQSILNVKLAEGVHNLTITYKGDETFNSSSIIILQKVSGDIKFNPDKTVVMGNYTVVTITVNLNDGADPVDIKSDKINVTVYYKKGNQTLNETMPVTINGQNISFKFPEDFDSAYATISYAVNNLTANTTIKVNTEITASDLQKADSEVKNFTIEVKGTNGHAINVTKDNIKVFNGAKALNIDVNNSVITIKDALTFGVYNLTIKYLGEDTYLASNKTIALTVYGINTTASANINSTKKGEIKVGINNGTDLITITKNQLNLTVTYKVGNDTFNITVTEYDINNGTLTFTLENGNFTTATLTIKYLNATKEVKLNRIYNAIFKPVNLYADYQDGNFTFLVIDADDGNPLVNKSVTIAGKGVQLFWKNGNSYSTQTTIKTDENGILTLVNENFYPGLEIATIMYAPNGDYNLSLTGAGDLKGSNTTTITIGTIAVNIVVEKYEEYYGSEKKVTITVTNAKTGKTVSGVYILINITGATLSTPRQLTNENGTIQLGVSVLPTGTYKMSLESNDTKLNHSTGSGSFTLKKIPVVITGKDVTIQYNTGTTYTIKVTKDGKGVDGVYVFVRLYSTAKKYKDYIFQTDKNGKLSFSASLAVGKHKIIVTSADTRYDAKQITKTITVKKAKAKISAKKVKTYYKSGKTFNMKLINSKNKKPIYDAKINFKFYNTKNRVFTASSRTALNGQIKLLLDGLKPDTYKVVITGADNKNFEAKKVTTKLVIKKAPAKISAKKLTAKKGAKKYLKIKVKNKKTKKMIAKVKVKVKVYTGKKAKTYKVKTNAKGVAKLSVKKLKVGKHKVVITSGDKYVTAKKAKTTIKIKK